MGSFHITVGKVYLFTYYDDAVYGRYCPWDNNNYGNNSYIWHVFQMEKTQEIYMKNDILYA